jgi:glycine/D-amino acid oxidase-like deaminating enzyme
MAGSGKHLEGWFSPAAASVQPGKLVRGLRRVALQLGVKIHESTAMTGLEEGRPARLQTPHGTVIADRVVLAMNAWMARAFPQFQRSVAIVSSDMLITTPRTVGSCLARAATPSRLVGACCRYSINRRRMPAC